MRCTLPPEDVTVLLDEAAPRLVSLEEKERLISQGVSYGELLSAEEVPSDLQRWTFAESLERCGPRVAALLADLAAELWQHYGERAVLVSLARGGTPVGCSLRRLARRWGTDWPHYTVSIIRGVGLDSAALSQIRQAHPGQPLVFVDGWTGKGSIFSTLSRSLPPGCPPTLAVLSDPAGVAAHAATFDDLLLPHAALNATVCGLLSRTFLPPDGGEGRHAVRIEEALRPFDQTGEYLAALDSLWEPFAQAPAAAPRSASPRPVRPFGAVWELAQARGVTDPHRVKPSVGEATRVFLRRRPAGLWVRDRQDADVAHLLVMADEAGVDVTEVPQLPYRAAALIGAGEGE